jgi:anhydro-N-acetylmuramic acid kinase
MKIVGLMSGTSMDGIDAALLELDGVPSDAEWSLLAFRSAPYDDDQRARIKRCVEAGTPDLLCRLHADLGEWLADAALAVIAEADADMGEIAAVGSHGHTVWHVPPDRAGRGSTLQLGDPATIAERTGMDVVADFRTRDMAAGGQGAPLVPFADRILFSLPGRRRALQNLGGIGNVTWLPPRGADEPPLAFDTGPGNALIDLAAERASGGRLRCDLDGRLAARGRVDAALLERLMADGFFALEPPRSTGRERFGHAFIERIVAQMQPRDEAGWADLIATLTALTARSIGDAYRRWVVPRGVDEVVLTGGGAKNPALAAAIRAELAPLALAGAEALGLDPDAREAAAFAVLAWAHLLGASGNVPEVTGARGPRVLGSLTPGRAALPKTEGPRQNPARRPAESRNR